MVILPVDVDPAEVLAILYRPTSRLIAQKRWVMISVKSHSIVYLDVEIVKDYNVEHEEYLGSQRQKSSQFWLYVNFADWAEVWHKYCVCNRTASVGHLRLIAHPFRVVEISLNSRFQDPSYAVGVPTQLESSRIFALLMPLIIHLHMISNCWIVQCSVFKICGTPNVVRILSCRLLSCRQSTSGQTSVRPSKILVPKHWNPHSAHKWTSKIQIGPRTQSFKVY